MKKLIVLLVLALLSIQPKAKAEELTAESAGVKNMWQRIQQELRIPPSIVKWHEGEEAEVHFTLDSAGKIKVVAIENASSFLKKQLRISFEEIQLPGNPLLEGQRFSLKIKLQ